MERLGTIATAACPATAIGTALKAITRALRHPAAWTFVGIYIVATAALVVTGHADLLPFQVGIDAILAVLSGLTVIMTSGAPGEEGAAPSARGRAMLQLALAALYTVYVAVFINGHAPAPAPLAAVNHYADGLPVYLRDPLLYFALPALALAATGAGRRALGLARGWRAWRVAALWGIVPLYVVALALAAGAATPAGLLASLIGNALRNGFFEEFLWRGAILTRLRGVVGTGWAITLSSLGFGLWHLGPDTARLGGNFVAGLAYCVVCQATVGLGFAVAFVRTRNLLVPSVAHVLFNVA
jgi:membrane protease YdiL (CAAX protease family)